MSPDSPSVTLPHGIHEHEGRLWRTKPGATSTFEESIAARRLIVDLHADEFWNPWRMEEQADGFERAQRVMAEWERAEPNFACKTKRQLDAQSARWDRDFERRNAVREARRQENLKRYDQEREQARLALLESQAILAHKATELARVRSREAFPAMNPTRRADQLAELHEAVARCQARVEQVAPVVGDPEEVVDKHGLLPADRRFSTLYEFRDRRITEVMELRAVVPELAARLKATDNRLFTIRGVVGV